VRLLLDQNLSPRLVPALVDLYPGSAHVREVGLQTADDDTVWHYAAAHGFVIVSKDAEGHPPKVIWIRRGDCSTDDVISLLRDHHAALLMFERDEEASFLALG
jgi:predicted nuclease of predicted toxin-antitoxin system